MCVCVCVFVCVCARARMRVVSDRRAAALRGRTEGACGHDAEVAQRQHNEEVEYPADRGDEK